VPRYYPACLDIKGKKCVVVGGGEVAERKVNLLLRCGADITIISPDLTEGLEEFSLNGEIKYIKDEFKEKHLKNAFLVIGATDNHKVNLKIYKEGSKNEILVNIADSPDLCNFTVPSVVERGELVIAISTGGKSPSLSKKIREELEARYGIEYAEFLKMIGELRERILHMIPDKNKREEIYKKLVYSDIIDLIKNGNGESARRRVEKIINSYNL